MFQPGFAYILPESIKYCEALRHKDSTKTIEDGDKVKVQSTGSAIFKNSDK